MQIAHLTTLLKRILILLAIACQKSEKNFVPSEKINKKCLSDFDEFFEKFGKDSLYQIDHIKFPIKYSFLSEDYQNVIDSILNKKDYHYINFDSDKKAMQSETGKYTVEKEKTKNKILYKQIGYDNGIYMTFEFQIINGCWYLVRISDEST